MAILVYSVTALRIGLCGIGAFALGAPQKGVHLRMVVAAIASGSFFLWLGVLLGMMVCRYSLPRRSRVLGVLSAFCTIELGALSPRFR